MDFAQILVIAAAALLYLLALPAQWRAWALMIGSVVAIYWLQPTLPIRWLDYALPTATLVLTMLAWWASRPRAEAAARPSRQDLLAGVVTLAIALLLALSRYVALPDALQLTSRPPEIGGVVAAIVLALAGWAALSRLGGRYLVAVALVGIIILLVVLQTPPLAAAASAFLRGQAGQDAGLASPLDLGWLGFSYVAFRLIHTLRDRQTGILPAVGLRDFITYVVFAPAYTAGPIDRLERFAAEVQTLPALNGRDPHRLTVAFGRISVGLFKKFVIADSLALFALDSTRAAQTESAPALWLLLYAYGLRLFLDFSGYTDIAIGLGMLFGVQLPENFDRPYTRTSITAFWQSWHMSLTNWVRFYIFSPLSRSLLRRQPRPTNEQIQFFCHISTMLIMGLWHGVTGPFVVWGLWHGLGLFCHKLWTDRTRKWYLGLRDRPRTRLAWAVTGWLLTFHFVMLGWVWFSMPDMTTAARVFAGLFGVRL
jgi:alginate O-acetyltransferase complex protein AlgI